MAYKTSPDDAPPVVPESLAAWGTAVGGVEMAWWVNEWGPMPGPDGLPTNQPEGEEDGRQAADA